MAIKEGFAALSSFFKWDATRQSRSEEAHEQKCLGYTDKLIDELDYLKPMLLSLNTTKAAKNRISDVYTYIRKYKAHRSKC